MPIYPSTRQLEIICALGRTLSFSRAAATLNLSQSALSQAVAQAELLLGAKLFQRTKRSVLLTAPGERFVAQAERLLAGLDRAITELSSGSDPGRGRVDIACIASVSVGILPSVVRAFRAAHPEAVVRVRDDDPDGIIRRVRSGGVDLAISVLFEADAGVSFKPLIEDDIRLVCRHDHPLSQHESVTWTDLAAFDLVAMAQGTGLRRLIDRQLPGIDLFRDATYEIARVPSILDVVEQSDCVSVIPALMLASPHVAGRFHHRRLTDPSITRSIGLITPKDVPLSATAEAFYQALAAHLRAIKPDRYPFVRFDARTSEARD